MRVAFLTTSYPTDPADPRGIHVHRMALSASRAGAQVTVFAPVTRTAQYQIDGLDVVPVPYGFRGHPGRLATGISGIVPNLRSDPRLALEIPSLIGGLKDAVSVAARNHDVLHAHWLVPTGLAASLAPSPFRRSVLTAHGGDAALLKRFRLAALTEKILRNVDQVTAVSEAIAEDLIWLGSRPQSTTVLPLGVHVIPNRPCRNKLATFSFLFVGGLSPRKSVATLIRAFSFIRSGQTRLVIAGDGPLRPKLESLALSGPRAGDISFLGSISPAEARNLMEEADVLVLPSKSEGRPVVVMEAMGAWMPVIASDIPGTRELVKHGKTGLLFQFGDVHGLADAMQTLASNPLLVEEYGANGRDLLIDLGLTEDAMGQRLISLYEGLDD